MAALRSCFFCEFHVPGEMDALRGSQTLGISLELSEIGRQPELPSSPSSYIYQAIHIDFLNHPPVYIELCNPCAYPLLIMIVL